MSDEIEAFTEGARAVQEVAKTGRALIEPGTELAHYVARVLGTVPEDVVGFLIGDPLRELRQHTLTSILRAVFEKLRKRGVETAKPIRPEPGKEAFEAASLETDETLQDMWAELLANAMDPNKDTSLQRVFIETLKRFEPIDAFVLKNFLRLKPKPTGYPASKIADILGLRQTLIVVSLQRLLRLDVIHISENDGTYTVGALGTELHLACTGDAPD